MVKDHTDSERGNPLPLHGLFFPINSKGSFICTISHIAHTTAFVTPVVENSLKREIAQWVHPMKDRSDDPSPHALTTELHLWETFSLMFISVLEIFTQTDCDFQITHISDWMFVLLGIQVRK